MSFLCLFGRGTKISKYLVDHDKIYETVIRLGIKTSTGDIEGEIIKRTEVDIENIKEEKIRSVLDKFIGKQEQIPPMYSAIKVKRKKTIWICKRRKKYRYKAKEYRSLRYYFKWNRQRK